MSARRTGFVLDAANEASRFAGRPASLSLAATIILILLTIFGVSVSSTVSSMRPKYEPLHFGLAQSARVTEGAPPNKIAKDEGAVDDHDLYARIITRVAQGENYYQAAAAEQRLGNYPLKPFLTMRLPTLAWIEAALGQIGTLVAAIILAAATIFAWHRRFVAYWRETGRETKSLVPVLVIFMGLIPLFLTKWELIHEVWAGALIALSIALYRPQKPFAAIVAAFAALAIRETSLPYILLLGAFVLWNKQWRYAAIIALGTLIFLAVLKVHADHVAAVVRPDDLAGPGWFKSGGFATYLLFARETTVLRSVSILTAFVVPLCLLGWLSMKSQTGLLIFLFQVGYAIIFMILGRADNFYWGMMIAPTLLAGLLFAPAAIKNLWLNWKNRPSTLASSSL